MTTQIQARPHNTGPVFETDERSFREAVLERSRTVPVVVDFWAPWCGPCRTLGPTLERLAAEAKGAWILAKINVDNNQRLAQAFGIQGIPAVKAFRDGRVVEEFTGAQPESQIRAWLKRVVPVQVDPAEEAAALEATNPSAAAARYQAILASEPGNEAAQFGLGRLLVSAGDPSGAELLKGIQAGTPLYSRAQAWLTLADLVNETAESSPAELQERVENDPADLEARYQLAAHQVSGRRYADAIEQLLAIVERNRAFRDDGGRRVLLALFAALGDQDPLVPGNRRRLANMLF